MNKVGPILAVGTAGLILAALWLRTGLVPAVSGGDEVWWGESGYQWLQGGVLRWACLDDDRGSALMSMWPPTVALLQAAFIRLFGLNAFGLTVQSSVVATALMGAVYWLARNLGFARARAGWAACAIFGPLMIERRLLQVRMENLTALCAVFYFALLWQNRGSQEDRPVLLRGLLAGIVLGIGLFSYYPQAPFLLLGVGVAWWLMRPAQPAPTLAALLGLTVVGALGALWILPNWPLFYNQILLTGSEKYFSIKYLLRPFMHLAGTASILERVRQTEEWLVLAVGICALGRSQSPAVRGLGAMTVAGSLTMFVFDPSLQVFAGIFAVLLVFHPDFTVGSARFCGLKLIAQKALVIVAVGKLTLIAFTGLYQYQGRDYAAVARELQAIVSVNDRVGISQEAWLALRSRIAADNLHLLVYSDTSIGNRPRVARTAGARDYFDCLVLRQDYLPQLRRVYPWLGPALDQHYYHLVRDVSLPLRPLPWSTVPPYNLLVYRRASGQPAPVATKNASGS